MNKRNLPIEIYLIRHGEAESSWDKDKDPSLSIKGIEQASKLSEDLESLLDPKAYNIVSSPLRRAKETAEPYRAKKNYTLEINDTFSEIPSPGINLSQRKEWLKKIFVSSVSNLDKPQKVWQERIFKSISLINKPTLIFSHFMVINTIVSKLKKSKNLVVFSPDNCSITKLIKRNEKLELMNLGKELITKVN